MLFFFFSSRRRHTRFDCDWSSDVCSSDLWDAQDEQLVENFLIGPDHRVVERVGSGAPEIGRASCRERVYISVVAVSLKKKKRGKQHIPLDLFHEIKSGKQFSD